MAIKLSSRKEYIDLQDLAEQKGFKSIEQAAIILFDLDPFDIPAIWDDYNVDTLISLLLEETTVN